MSNYQLTAISGHLLGVSEQIHYRTFNGYVVTFCERHDKEYTLAYYKMCRLLRYLIVRDNIIIGTRWHTLLLEHGSRLSSANFKATIKGTEYQFDSAPYFFKQISKIWSRNKVTKHKIAMEKKRMHGETLLLVVEAMLEFIGGQFKVGTENALVLAGYDNFSEKSQKNMGFKRQPVL